VEFHNPYVVQEYTRLVTRRNHAVNAIGPDVLMYSVSK
jgi:hypothetical protein